MAYAQGRTFCDADSHIMELPDFLTDFADPGLRDQLPRISFAGGGRSSRGVEEAAKRGGQPPDKVAEMVAMGDELISGPKGYQALGAFNRTERTQALDPLGFDRQLVFTTFAGACFYSGNFSRLFHL